MTVVHVSERKLSTTSLNDKYKPWKEIEGGQNIIATSKQYPVAKNTVSYWLKNKSKIFEEDEENNVSKKLKIIKTATYEEVDSVKEWKT